MKPTNKSSADKRMKKEAASFIDMLERFGGGSVSINGKEVVHVQPFTERIACWKCGSEDPATLEGSDYCINCIRRERQP